MRNPKGIYNFYIDESGDEGIKKGSEYFVLTAIGVKKDEDLKISKIVDEIKTELNKPLNSQLHWNRTKSKNSKKYILNEISAQNITIISIIINTSKICNLNSKEVYYYYAGYLFNAILEFCDKNKSKANINISSRTSLTKEKLIDFIFNKSSHKIDKDKIVDIKIYDNSDKKLLQIADCCCSSLGQFLKYKDDFHYEYYKTLKKNYYNKKGKVGDYGIKVIPSTKPLPKEIQKILQ